MKYLKKTLRLMYVIPAAVGLFFFNLAKRNPKHPVHNQTPILFIHGYLYRSGCWAYIFYHLKKAGYQHIYSINLGSPFNSIDSYTQKVKKQIEEIGSKEIILIGHSMGGLIATYYDHHYAKPGEIKLIITLGSPMEGTRVASLGYAKCTEEMLPGSALLKNLSIFTSTTPYLHVASETDSVINPWESALFKSSSSVNVNRQLFDSIGHLQFLFSKKIVDVIIAQLANNSNKP